MRFSWISAFVTLIIVYVAITRLDWLALWNAVQKIEFSLLLVALFTWVLVVTTKSIKWKLLISTLGGKISVMESFKILMIGLFVGVITPGRMGDFVRAAYVKEKIGLGSGVMGVFVDRAMDVFTLLVFSAIGIIGLFRATGIHLIPNEVLLAIFIIFCLAVFLSLKKGVARRIWPFAKSLFPIALSNTISKYGNQFYSAVPLLKKNRTQVLTIFCVGILAWLLTITFGFFLMQGARIQLDWQVALLVVPVLALIEIIPFGVAGLGTREVAAVIVLGAYSIPPENAVLFSLLYFAFGYIPSFVLGSYFFNRQPFPLKGKWADWRKGFSFIKKE